MREITWEIYGAVMGGTRPIVTRGPAARFAGSICLHSGGVAMVACASIVWTLADGIVDRGLAGFIWLHTGGVAMVACASIVWTLADGIVNHGRATLRFHQVE